MDDGGWKMAKTLAALVFLHPLSSIFYLRFLSPSCPSYYYQSISLCGARISRREFDDIRLACGEQRGDRSSAPARQLIAVRFGDLVDQSVGAEQPEQSRDLAAASS